MERQFRGMLLFHKLRRKKKPERKEFYSKTQPSNIFRCFFALKIIHFGELLCFRFQVK
jgi:hypothetical protein